MLAGGRGLLLRRQRVRARHQPQHHHRDARWPRRCRRLRRAVHRSAGPSPQSSAPQPASAPARRAGRPVPSTSHACQSEVTVSVTDRASSGAWPPHARPRPGARPPGRPALPPVPFPHTTRRPSTAPARASPPWLPGPTIASRITRWPEHRGREPDDGDACPGSAAPTRAATTTPTQTAGSVVTAGGGRHCRYQRGEQQRDRRRELRRRRPGAAPAARGDRPRRRESRCRTARPSGACRPARARWTPQPSTGASWRTPRGAWRWQCRWYRRVYACADAMRLRFVLNDC